MVFNVFRSRIFSILSNKSKKSEETEESNQAFSPGFMEICHIIFISMSMSTIYIKRDIYSYMYIYIYIYIHIYIYILFAKGIETFWSRDVTDILILAHFES